MSEKPAIEKDILLETYKTQWADIHHSRDQDWELSKLILAGFLGLSGLTAFADTPILVQLLSISFIILSVLGILVTIRHKRLFAEKMAAIRILEKELNIDQLNLFKPTKGLRLFTTQNFLIIIYVLSALIFGIFLLLQVP
ncbi:MAG: hypothetical protein D6748_10160 [Calditrichaeota bacterium]|nr:MAG: hypothetical protein D6748_10160 [Calditrichota bacterium]